MGPVESGRSGSSDRGESTPVKKKTPKKSTKASKAPELQADLKSLDDKWSQCFARLEALFLAKTFHVPVELVQQSNMVVSDKPFIPPEQQPSGQPSTSGATGQMKKATQPSEVPGALTATRPVEASGATEKVQPTSQEAASKPEVQPPGPTGQSASTFNWSTSLTGLPAPSEEPVSDEEHLSDHPSPSLDEEGELSDAHSLDPGCEELLDTDQELSAEQTYRETIRRVRSFMGWNQVPKFDSASSSQDDNPFAGTRSQQPSKMSVKVPVDDWLCRKFEKLSVTMQEGYPSRASETAGLNRDQFVKPPKTLKWNDMFSEKNNFSRSKVSSWTNEPARLNSSFPRIANHSLPTAPVSSPVSQDTLRRWERAARDQSYMCNQADGLSRCLTKVQDSMTTQTHSRG